VTHVVVTRAEASDGPLSSELRSLGVPVLLWPAVSVTPVDTELLYTTLKGLATFDWVVFASRHAVAAVTQRIANPPEGLRVAAIGQATAQVLKQRGWPVDLLPSESNAAALVSAFAAPVVPALAAAPSHTGDGAGTRRPLEGARILYPASSRALPTLAAGLRQLGAEVLQVEAYRTESAPLDAEECKAWIARGSIAAVTFSSPSTVVELERTLGKESFDRLLAGAAAVAIGPTTARELTQRGHPSVLAEAATLRGLALTTHRLLQTKQAMPPGGLR